MIHISDLRLVKLTASIPCGRARATIPFEKASPAALVTSGWPSLLLSCPNSPTAIGRIGTYSKIDFLFLLGFYLALDCLHFFSSRRKRQPAVSELMFRAA